MKPIPEGRQRFQELSRNVALVVGPYDCLTYLGSARFIATLQPTDMMKMPLGVAATEQDPNIHCDRRTR